MSHVENLVEKLNPGKIQSIGAIEWYIHHASVSKLNNHAYHQVAERADETVKDALICYDKIKVLVEETINIGFWKENIYPKFWSKLPDLPSVQTYIPIYHEAVLVNLLTNCLFYREAVEALGDYSIDLVEYVYQKLVYLMASAEPSKELRQSEEFNDKTIENHKKECDFSIACSCVSILQYLTDQMNALSPSVIFNLLDEKDILLTLVPLITKEPWKRKTAKGVEIYSGNRWETIDPEEEPRVVKLTAQVWMCVYSLLMNSECRGRYEMTYFRKNNLLQLRKHLNENLVNQIPPLEHLKRLLEELGFQTSLPQSTVPKPILISGVPKILSELQMKYPEDTLEDIAEQQKNLHFVENSEKSSKICKLIADLYEERE